jgi:tRNA dimethylallyltransferase
MMMSKIVVIIGPTACGKTKISIELAKKLNAEIINADAVQVYKDVNIGTAKITKEEMEGISHHLIDFVSLDKKYTIYDYQKDGRRILNKLIKENRNIIIVGGSGLYIKSLLYDYNLEGEIKKENIYQDLSNEELKSLVDKIDSNNDIHINSRKRLLRYLEHYNNTGKATINNESKNKPLYDFKVIYLKPDREELYNYINNRVEKMISSGLLQEARYLYDNNVNTNSIIGYKELNEYFNNKISLEEAIDNIKKNTRHYAKRQLTWFNNQFKDKIEIKVDYNNFNKTIKGALKVI